MTASRRARLCLHPLLLPGLFLSSLPAFCGQGPAGPKRLTVEPPAQIAVKRGARVVQKLAVTVEPGFHVNSDKPKDEFLIPLKLTWTGSALQSGVVAYPKSEDVQVGKDQVSVFTGKFTIDTQFAAAAGAMPGPALMTGKLHYQACNNQMCFRPTSIEVRLPVVIE